MKVTGFGAWFGTFLALSAAAVSSGARAAEECEKCRSSAPVQTSNLRDLRLGAASAGSGCLGALSPAQVQAMDCLEDLLQRFEKGEVDLAGADSRAVRCAEAGGQKKAVSLAFASQYLSERIQAHSAEARETARTAIQAARDYLRATQEYNTYRDSLHRAALAIAGSSNRTDAESRMITAGNRMNEAQVKLLKLAGGSPQAVGIHRQIVQVVSAANQNIDDSLKKLDEIEKADRGVILTSAEVALAASTGFAGPALTAVKGSAVSGSAFLAARSLLRSWNAGAHGDDTFWCRMSEELVSNELLLTHYAPVSVAFGVAFDAVPAAIAKLPEDGMIAQKALPLLTKAAAPVKKALPKLTLAAMGAGTANGVRKAVRESVSASRLGADGKAAESDAKAEDAWNSAIDASFAPAAVAFSVLGQKALGKTFDIKGRIEAWKAEKLALQAEKERLRQIAAVQARLYVRRRPTAEDIQKLSDLSANFPKEIFCYQDFHCDEDFTFELFRLNNSPKGLANYNSVTTSPNGVVDIVRSDAPYGAVNGVANDRIETRQTFNIQNLTRVHENGDRLFLHTSPGAVTREVTPKPGLTTKVANSVGSMLGVGLFMNVMKYANRLGESGVSLWSGKVTRAQDYAELILPPTTRPAVRRMFEQLLWQENPAARAELDRLLSRAP